MEATVQAIATARGKFGSSAEYLFQTQAALESHGILDARVKRLADRVKSYLARGGGLARAS
jgi:cation transport regulator ChaC